MAEKMRKATAWDKVTVDDRLGPNVHGNEHSEEKNGTFEATQTQTLVLQFKTVTWISIYFLTQKS